MADDTTDELGNTTNEVGTLDVDIVGIIEPADTGIIHELALDKAAAVAAATMNEYVNKEKLTKALKAWLADRHKEELRGAPLPPLPDYVCSSIIQIATNLSFKWNFRGYSFREDMVGDAILNVFKYIHNFNPDAETRAGPPNPFWYISRSCINTFKYCIKREELQHYYKLVQVGSIEGELLADVDFVQGLTNGASTARDMFFDMQSKAGAYENKRKAHKASKASSEPIVKDKVSATSIAADFI